MSTPYHRVIHENEQRFRIATDAAGIGVWELDMRNGEFYWNPRMYDLYGVAPVDGPLGYSEWERRLLPEDRCRALQRIWTGVEQGHPWEVTFRIRRGDGTIRDIRSVGQQLYDERGEPSRLFGINEDITERCQADRARVQSELEHCRALSAIGRELRNPLSALRRCHERLDSAALDAEQRHCLALARIASDTLLAQIDAILDQAWADSSRAEVQAEPFDLRRCLSEQIALLRELAERKGLILSLEWGRDLPARVCGDETRLLQVVHNLTRNAIQYTDQGWVCVRVRRLDATRIEVAVADTGPGIRPEDQDLIFEAFRRERSAGNGRGGSGFGLYICRQVVWLLGGEIRVESEPGAGATFTFSAEYPEVAEGEGSGCCETDTVPPEARPAHRRSAGLDVLVVANDPDQGRLLYELLLRIHCAPRLVDNGADALAEWQRQAPSLMLLELELGDLDGRTVVQRVREAERGVDAPRTPIAVMTAYPLAEVQRDCLQAGADQVLKQRVGLAALQQLIGRVRGETPQTLRCPV
ncbi:hybrid sensor histidine kinase/response regulator [Halorhodospira halophila]|uniref:histidine kinase n=1 Tax=Halorhodospira halophila (strain DSM 244 / SL1) TaxID=349124 RepID=A1WTZ9_HALHL|nr:hybrid sensor histidine kinase/response regulator [Halorhodospira halophila]ABM61161.1 PAS/PAC sensor hybrid histidine kinase [Halorhodospira halophila SL1]MBK1729646.1 hybrid sensor histidine kinase/response regulator [Halorhodospira halophila]